MYALLINFSWLRWQRIAEDPLHRNRIFIVSHLAHTMQISESEIQLKTCQLNWHLLDLREIQNNRILAFYSSVLISATGSSKLFFRNTTCPPRQYFHFGSCLHVDDKCQTFDPFTGDCLTCTNSTHSLTDGKCIPKTVICAERQWKSDGGNCLNVSDLCDAFDPSNGNCLSCKSSSLQPANSSCVPIVVVCPPRQYAADLICVSIPAECSQFDTANGVCLHCIQGYFVEAGKCKRMLCPPNQVPSRFGLFCIDVSPLCDSFDQLTGECLACKEPNQRVDSTGKCVQTNSPLAGCKERQRLGFGACLNADKNCKAYNLRSRNCDECEKGFYLDFTGHCQREVQCQAGQWSSEGDCVGVAESCLRVDNLGLCVLCANSNYRLEHGQCVAFKRCAANQFLNAGGECVDVSSDCELFNPSSGECVTCKAGVEPRLGRCCPSSSIFDETNCVDAAVLQEARAKSRGSACMIEHPSLKHCLECSPWFTPDPLSLSTCVEV